MGSRPVGGSPGSTEKVERAVLGGWEHNVSKRLVISSGRYVVLHMLALFLMQGDNSLEGLRYFSKAVVGNVYALNKANRISTFGLIRFQRKTLGKHLPQSNKSRGAEMVISTATGVCLLATVLKVSSGLFKCLSKYHLRVPGVEKEFV